MLMMFKEERMEEGVEMKEEGKVGCDHQPHYDGVQKLIHDLIGAGHVEASRIRHNFACLP